MTLLLDIVRTCDIDMGEDSTTQSRNLAVLREIEASKTVAQEPIAEDGVR